MNWIREDIFLDDGDETACSSHIVSLYLPQIIDDGCVSFQVNATCDPELFQQICQRQCLDAECSFFGYKKFDCIPYVHVSYEVVI